MGENAALMTVGLGLLSLTLAMHAVALGSTLRGVAGLLSLGGIWFIGGLLMMARYVH